MKILFIDIDSLRPDHLGCYGYPRNTSPVIDELALSGVRFDNVYVSDTPCVPSRTALWSGRHGFRTGVVDQGGGGAEPFREASGRGFRDSFYTSGWMMALREAGHYTATISSFGERHSAWHWYAGFNEVINPGFLGMDRADDVVPVAVDWLRRQGREKPDWFLHVNLWDTHTPYRYPSSFRCQFTEGSGPDWLDEATLRRFWASYGPHSAREPTGFDGHRDERYPLQPGPVETLEVARAWWDGYDTALRYTDDWVGVLLGELTRLGLEKETTVVISADHGENLGELNVWGDHQTADEFTNRVPLIVRPAGGFQHGGRVDRGLRYQFDWAATLIELAGGRVPASWDGVSFASEFSAGQEAGREFLVLSHGAWSCQRGVRFNKEGHAFLLMVTYHDGYKDLAPIMLFDLTADPHELHNIAEVRPDVRDEGLARLTLWLGEMMRRSRDEVDPLMRVMREGGPFHCRGELPGYLRRLETTGRGACAEALAGRYGVDR
ncbi:MAG: sulfatase [Acetobacteraceae bacterium]|nr:sulfatase [Acetobacteraceae bacterium]